MSGLPPTWISSRRHHLRAGQRVQDHTVGAFFMHHAHHLRGRQTASAIVGWARPVRYLSNRAISIYARRKAKGPEGERMLAGVSFAESAILPISVDLVAIPLFLLAPTRIWRFCCIALAASILGGLVGYLLGYAFYETLGAGLLDALNMTAQFETLLADMAAGPWLAAWFVLLGAISPLPFKLVCIASGFAQLNLLLFLVFAVAGRAARFFALGAIFSALPADWRQAVLRHSAAMSAGIIAIVIAGFLAAGALA